MAKPRNGKIGNQALAPLKSRLKGLPVFIAHSVAQSAAPGLTSRAATAYDSGQTVYGEPRPESENGGLLRLLETGETRRDMRFVSDGRIIRCVLGPPYAKYLVGKYKILPNGALPVEWSRYLSEVLAKAKAERYLRVGP